jgi:hypothetical protein
LLYIGLLAGIRVKGVRFESLWRTLIGPCILELIDSNQEDAAMSESVESVVRALYQQILDGWNRRSGEAMAPLLRPMRS